MILTVQKEKSSDYRDGSSSSSSSPVKFSKRDVEQMPTTEDICSRIARRTSMETFTPYDTFIQNGGTSCRETDRHGNR